MHKVKMCTRDDYAKLSAITGVHFRVNKRLYDSMVSERNSVHESSMSTLSKCVSILEVLMGKPTPKTTTLSR